MRTLEQLRTQATDFKLNFRGVADSHTKQYVVRPFLEMQGLLLEVIDHLEELEKRMGDTDHRKLGGSSEATPASLPVEPAKEG